MTRDRKYRKTLIACYLGFVTQAITANFAPLLFLIFKSTYGITLEKIAMIPFVFYLAQLIVDLLATRFADRIGYRICVVFSQILSAAGLVLMAILPGIVSTPFIGILISVVLYAIGSGLIEVLVSPIVEACPFENKEGVMSLLHSFYCWGAVAVILGSTLFLCMVTPVVPDAAGSYCIVYVYEDLEGNAEITSVQELEYSMYETLSDLQDD